MDRQTAYAAAAERLNTLAVEAINDGRSLARASAAIYIPTGNNALGRLRRYRTIADRERYGTAAVGEIIAQLETHEPAAKRRTTARERRKREADRLSHEDGQRAVSTFCEGPRPWDRGASAYRVDVFHVCGALMRCLERFEATGDRELERFLALLCTRHTLDTGELYAALGYESKSLPEATRRARQLVPGNGSVVPFERGA